MLEIGRLLTLHKKKTLFIIFIQNFTCKILTRLLSYLRVCILPVNFKGVMVLWIMCLFCSKYILCGFKVLYFSSTYFLLRDSSIALLHQNKASRVSPIAGFCGLQHILISFNGNSIRFWHPQKVKFFNG